MSRWNDEGETSWFTYLLWNRAQAVQFAQNTEGRRHFTINRSWQPGMQAARGLNAVCFNWWHAVSNL